MRNLLCIYGTYAYFAILFLGVGVVFPTNIWAREYVAYSIVTLIQESDLVVLARVRKVELKESKEFSLTREANVKTYIAYCEPEHIFRNQRKQSGPFEVRFKDSDYYGPIPEPYVQNRTYLLFLASTTEGQFYALQGTQGIAPLEGDQVRFYFGDINVALAKSYLEIFTNSSTTAQGWEDLSRSLIAGGDLENSRRTLATFHLLSSLPTRQLNEDYFLRGLASRNGLVVEDAMRRLVAIESERGIAAIIDLYLRLKTENGWRNYSETYVLPYHFNQAFTWQVAEGAKAIIRKFREKYPHETELFAGT